MKIALFANFGGQLENPPISIYNTKTRNQIKSNQIKSKSFKIKIKIKIKIETETETKTNLKSKSSQGIFRYLAGVTSPHSADLGQVNGARLRTRAGTCAAENEPLEILGTLHSALCTLHSALYSLLSTLSTI